MMWNVIVETRQQIGVDEVFGCPEYERLVDSVLTKIYSTKGWAVREAKKWDRELVSTDGHRMVQKGVVRPVLKPVTEEEAKAEYCRCRPAYYDSETGRSQIRPSDNYGSHAPIEELFYRGIPYGYKGNFYIEAE